MTDIKEVVNLLESYRKLEEEIKVLTRTKGMSQDVLKESQAYHNFLNIGHEIEKYTLNGEKIIGIYKDIKEIAKQEFNFKEEEYKSRINDLEAFVLQFKDSKYNLINLISNPNNFFNGKIIEEIKKE